MSIGVIAIMSCTGSPERTLRPGWQEVRSEVLNFRVFMPDRPVQRMENATTKGGRPISMRSFTYSNGEDLTFVVSVTDLSEEPMNQVDIKRALDAGRDGVLTNVEGKLLDETNTIVEGYPARRLLYEFPNDQACEITAIIVIGRIYLLGAIQKRGKYPLECREFLDSFKLLANRR